MATPRGARGRIINARNASFCEFPINPGEITYTKGSKLIETETPGVSDAFVQWSSGGAESFSLSLRIHGEDNLRIRGNQIRNNAVPREISTADASQSYSVAGEAEWFLQFLHPVQGNQPGSDQGPDKVIVRVGRALPGVLALVENVKITYGNNDFTADLEPCDATVDISFKRVQFKPRFANDVWR